MSVAQLNRRIVKSNNNAGASASNGVPYAGEQSVPMPYSPLLSLTWSEYCYLFFVAVALALLIVPPDWNFAGRRFVRQLPLLATVPLAMLSAVGRRMVAAPTRIQSMLRSRRSALMALMPLLILGVWILVGSIHARVVEHFQSTFLNDGMYIGAAAAAALIMCYSDAPTRLAQAYLRLIACSAMVMIVGLIIVGRNRGLYHEQIFIAIPIAVACALSQGNRLRAWIGSALFLSIALLSAKNTSYIITLLSLLYIAALFWLNGIERAHSVKKLWLQYLAFTGAIVVAISIGLLIYFRANYLPTGNVEFRSFTYHAAWEQFLDSPLWGTSFSAESVRRFTLYTVGIARNRLPTHSDVMDLLANGGIVAMALWLWGYARVGMFAYRRVLAPQFLHYPWAGQAHTFAAISLAAITTYAFNPILLQPETAYLVWTTLGFLVGLAASCDPENAAGEIARRFHSPAFPDGTATRVAPFRLVMRNPHSHGTQQ